MNVAVSPSQLAQRVVLALAMTTCKFEAYGHVATLFDTLSSMKAANPALAVFDSVIRPCKLPAPH